MYYAAFQILQHDEDSEDAVHHAFIKIAENIEKLHSKGIKVNCWTCDDKEVAEKLDCSTGHAYKLIRSMNQELKKQGFYVIAGKIPRAFVEQKFFGMTLQAQ